MSLPGIPPVLALCPDTPSLKKHHTDINAVHTRRLHTFSKTTEIFDVWSCEVEARLPVSCQGGSFSNIWQRRETEIVRSPRCPVSLLPRPQPNEIETVSLQQVQVLVEVERRRGFGTTGVLKVRPGVGARQVHGAPSLVGEVARIPRTYAQRSRGRNGSHDRRARGGPVSRFGHVTSEVTVPFVDRHSNGRGLIHRSVNEHRAAIRDSVVQPFTQIRRTGWRRP